MLELLSVCLLGCTSLPPVTQADRLESAFRKVQNSVVTLRAETRMVVNAAHKGLVSVDSMGSGVLVSKAGEILTAAHVVQVADKIKVTLFNRTIEDVTGWKRTEVVESIFIGSGTPKVTIGPKPWELNSVPSLCSWRYSKPSIA